MYRKRNHNQVSVDDFIPPFGGRLSADNRWVKHSRVIPWDRVEERYAARFGKCGNVAIPLRVALGALIIREKCGFTDEETVQNLSENNYMQYFVGYTAFRPGQPFAPSLMVEFRKRIDMAEIQTIIDEVDERMLSGSRAGRQDLSQPRQSCRSTQFWRLHIIRDRPQIRLVLVNNDATPILTRQGSPSRHRLTFSTSTQCQSLSSTCYMAKPSILQLFHRRHLRRCAQRNHPRDAAPFDEFPVRVV